MIYNWRMKFQNTFDPMQEMLLLVYLLFHSLGCLYDLESNREQFHYLLKACDIFLKDFESMDSLNLHSSQLSILKVNQIF